ncbi:MAG: transposase [Synergistaceae bacterium]|nr:transposase [Synergistaceae bacterium]
MPVDSSREMTRMFYAGIDTAKRKHEISIIDTEGRALSQNLSFTNDREGSDRILALFERLNISAKDLVIGMEATGHYWLRRYSRLLEKGMM